MDAYSILIMLGLVLFGGLCAAALLYVLHIEPLEKRMRKAERCLAVNDAVYKIHYRLLIRQANLLDERMMAIAREMPTHPPPSP